MSGYASQITPEDRWAVVSWIRTLQASQNMPGDFLAKEDKEALDAAAAGSAGADAAPHGPHSPSKKSSSSSSLIESR
jgi:hypothetical protein